MGFYFTEDLVNSVKRSGLIPISQSTFTDPDDFIAIANDAMMHHIVSRIMTQRSDLFLTYVDVPLVANQDFYPVPSRAIENSLKDIFYMPNVNSPENRYSLAKVPVHDQQRYNLSNGQPTCFTVMGDEIQIQPKLVTVSGNERIRFYYYQRPSDLVSTTSCAKITAISSVSGTTTFTVDTDLTASLSVGTLIDLLNSVSPFLLWQYDVAITAITSTTIAVATADITDLAGVIGVGLNDYICPAKQSNIPMVPQEFHRSLAEYVIADCYKAMGAYQNFATAKAEAKEMMDLTLQLISNRVESALDVIYDSSGHLSNMGNYQSRVLIR
jgi:hypothetical protein